MKKKISIIGFGYNTKKNIIPALENSKNLEIDKIFIKNKKIKNKNLIKYNFQPISNLKNIKRHSWVYISTPISSHYSIIKKLIDFDANIICEKPLTNSFSKTKILLNLLKKKPTINLIEVQMYKFHRLYVYFKKFIKKNIKNITQVDFIFRIPKVDKKNSIYSSKKSGGALLSLGFYPVTSAIDIFGYPKNIKSNIKFSRNKNIDIEGNFRLKYKKIICEGHWALGSNYENQAKVYLKNKTSAIFNMFYAKNEGKQCNILKINSKKKVIKKIQIKRDNQFLNMITSYVYDKKKKHNINAINLQVIKFLEILKKNS